MEETAKHDYYYLCPCLVPVRIHNDTTLRQREYIGRLIVYVCSAATAT